VVTELGVLQQAERKAEKTPKKKGRCITLNRRLKGLNPLCLCNCHVNQVSDNEKRLEGKAELGEKQGSIVAKLAQAMEKFESEGGKQV